MYWNQFCYIFFQFWEILSQTGVAFYELNRANTQNLGKINFDMFYKNACWAVICYPICVTNVSYERKIIVLPFPVISFVILIFVSQIFEIKSGFPFYWLTLYTWTELFSTSVHFVQMNATIQLWTSFIHIFCTQTALKKQCDTQHFMGKYTESKCKVVIENSSFYPNNHLKIGLLSSRNFFVDMSGLILHDSQQ